MFVNKYEYKKYTQVFFPNLIIKKSGWAQTSGNDNGPKTKGYSQLPTIADEIDSYTKKSYTSAQVCGPEANSSFAGSCRNFKPKTSLGSICEPLAQGIRKEYLELFSISVNVRLLKFHKGHRQHVRGHDDISIFGYIYRFFFVCLYFCVPFFKFFFSNSSTDWINAMHTEYTLGYHRV